LQTGEASGGAGQRAGTFRTDPDGDIRQWIPGAVGTIGGIRRIGAIGVFGKDGRSHEPDLFRYLFGIIPK